jgi:hypothetical protein
MRTSMKRVLLIITLFGCAAVQTFGCIQFINVSCGSATVNGTCLGYARSCSGTSSDTYIQTVMLNCSGNTGGWSASQPHESDCTYTCTIDCWGSPKELSNTIPHYDYAPLSPGATYCTGSPCGGIGLIMWRRTLARGGTIGNISSLERICGLNRRYSSYVQLEYC